MAVNGPAVAALGAGAVLLWSALFNKSVTSTIQDVVSGKKPTPGPGQISGSSSSGSGGGAGAPSAPANVTGNVKIGKALASAYGWGSGTQWDDLYALWERESGWNNLAKNASSGAYGIPQALPASKMYGGTSSPTLQIQWGLGYISSRYGSPTAAWAHETSNGWY